MYTINQYENKGLSYVVLENTTATAKAEICLSRGGALESLTLKSQKIIEDLSPLDYKDTYASSILFPFASRIKDGKYQYKNQEFQLECNETETNNALHGFVYNKTFNVVSSDTTEDQATVVLKYEEANKTKGFPFLFSIILTFRLEETGLSLEVEIENTDTATFPFTLGWHPYFVSEDLSKSSLEFSSVKTVTFDNELITNGFLEEKLEMPFEIKDKRLDNCYVLDNEKVVFNTPTYRIAIESSEKENYFQVYTPPRANTIALEPVTGISNSFNNKVGIQELAPGKTHVVTWKVLIN